MITTDTVFILGAGASNLYGYPTGEELREVILNKFCSSGEIKNILYNSKIIMDFMDLDEFRAAFFKSSTPSIDLFLARNNQFSELGKIAIVSSILDAENNSIFREDIHKNRRNQDWYKYLFSRMVESLIKPNSYRDFGDNQVTFITFNYDRSLEHYLHESLSHLFYSQQFPNR